MIHGHGRVRLRLKRSPDVSCLEWRKSGKQADSKCDDWGPSGNQFLEKKLKSALEDKKRKGLVEGCARLA